MFKEVSKVKYIDNENYMDFIDVRNKYTDYIIFCLMDDSNTSNILYKPVAIIEEPGGNNYSELSHRVFKEFQNKYPDIKIRRLQGVNCVSQYRINI